MNFSDYIILNAKNLCQYNVRGTIESKPEKKSEKKAV